MTRTWECTVSTLDGRPVKTYMTKGKSEAQARNSTYFKLAGAEHNTRTPAPWMIARAKEEYVITCKVPEPKRSSKDQPGQGRLF